MKKYMALELAEVALSDFNIRVNNPNKDPGCIVAYVEINDVTVAILRSVQKMKLGILISSKSHGRSPN